MNSLLDLSVVQLRRAAELKEQIDGLNNELAAILRGVEPAATSGRARQAERMRAYWAAKRVGKTATSAAGSSDGQPKRRKMSAAGRAKIAAAARARWAKVRAAKEGK